MSHKHRITGSTPVLRIQFMCKAGGKGSGHINYGKPHVPVDGLYDGQPRQSCKYCGKWLIPEEEINVDKSASN